MSEQDTEQQEAIIPETEVEVEESTPEETGETQVEEQEEMVPKSQFNQAIARAKKAEAEAKALKAKPQPQITQPVSNDTVDERILRAQGITEDRIDFLKGVASVRKTGLIEAQNDPLYKAYEANKEAEEKAQKAKLGASKGSGSAKKTKDLNTPGLSPEEHRQMWREKNGLI